MGVVIYINVINFEESPLFSVAKPVKGCKVLLKIMVLYDFSPYSYMHTMAISVMSPPKHESSFLKIGFA